MGGEGWAGWAGFNFFSLAFKGLVRFYSPLLSSRFCWYNLCLQLEVINQKTEGSFFNKCLLKI